MKYSTTGLALAACLFAASSVQATLLLHYEYEQIDGTGPYTTPDSSGLGNDGTLAGGINNTALVAGGVFGSAIEVPGGLNRVQVADGDSDFDTSYSEFTFATWLSPYQSNPPAGTTRWIAGKMGASGNRGWQLAIDDNPDVAGHNPTLILTYFDGPSGSAQDVWTDVNPLVDEAWTHIAFVFTGGGSVKFYVDGIEVATSVAGGVLSSFNGSNNADLQIGNRGNTQSSSYSGLYDDTRIYNEALDASEVAALVPEPASVSLLMLSAALFARRMRRGN